jgi:hypothetical protein
MRAGFWRRAATGLATLIVGLALAWAGCALIAPGRVGLSALPPPVTALPFDRRFWATLLLLLGAATMLHALPPPPWTARPRSRS